MALYTVMPVAPPMLTGFSAPWVMPVVPAMLSEQKFGNFVIQRLLEHGSAEYRRRIALALAPCACDLARSRRGSNVIRRAMVHCSEPERSTLAQALAAGAGGLAGLAKHLIGSHVVWELKRMGLACRSGRGFELRRH
mmetsp:Transcript_58393/g.114852  ORF Transcript_58393/g.114852 Transcript_58393/m.114852 type:complete len:137 (-) Transcript_58393:256-666(-)